MDLGTLAAIAAAVVALGAMGVAIFQADAAKDQAHAAKKQADAAEDQAATAREQAEMARRQAAAAWEQVVEARRANDEAAKERAERRAREAVRWMAEVEPGWDRIKVRNVGTDTAWEVQVQAGGTDEDWQFRWESEQAGDCDFDEVRAGDYFPFNIEDHIHPPEQIYVYWRGAPHPTAVIVKGSPP